MDKGYPPEHDQYHPGEDCPECESNDEHGYGFACIEHSPCCGEPIAFGSDCCSMCKEHTGIDNT